jgi:hypothetical protein
MANVINWPGRGRSSCPAGRSAGSVTRERGRLASVVPLRSRGPTTQGGFVPAGTTSQPFDVADQGLGPSRPVTPKSDLCPEALAFRELIMDDKSMQAWTNLQLTLPEPIRKIRVVGRPNEPSSPAAYRAAFFKRVRTARELYSDSPQDMAKVLGIPAGTYTRYETRTMLPHHLVPRFCQITGVTPEWLFFGPTAARALTSTRAATGTDPL